MEKNRDFQIIDEYCNENWRTIGRTLRIVSTLPIDTSVHSYLEL